MTPKGHLSCPNCGNGFDRLQKSMRMFDCPSCGTTLFREADALAPIGNHGEMHEVPMLLGLGDKLRVGRHVYRMVGHARFDYGRGWWDELWALDGSGNGAWISIDEGDVILQTALPEGQAPKWNGAPPLGSSFRVEGETYTVTEADTAACVAIRGEFPEVMEIGERHDFVNAAGDDGALISGEFWAGGRAWYRGRWLDPFDLKPDRAA
ncbi:DUF4178 domain-containing protein [Rhodophyticola sp.]|jgi:predicted RNA-binding Zn-ribbon protein involved in translation (DUF1610 family)|uniref:DUF4178 domain-containing protein n=1 Tax=Rhodophyticola sp. TaxID=2680032 RepID=UPI003D2BC06A